MPQEDVSSLLGAPAGCAGVLLAPALRGAFNLVLAGPWVRWPQGIWRRASVAASSLRPLVRLAALTLVGWTLGLGILGILDSKPVAPVLRNWPEAQLFPYVFDFCFFLVPFFMLTIALTRLACLSFLFSTFALAPVHIGWVLWAPARVDYYSVTVGRRPWLALGGAVGPKERALAASKRLAYLGQSLTIPALRTGLTQLSGWALTEAQRETHMWVVGGTGVGKTRSVLEPLIRADIIAGRPVVVIDGKGDQELLQRIIAYALEAGRDREVYTFDLSHPNSSDTYNPLLRGNPTEIKDKLMASFPEGRGDSTYYRNHAQLLILDVLRALRSGGHGATLQDLHAAATTPDALIALYTLAQDDSIKQELQQRIETWNADKFSGLSTHLALICKSDFGHLFNTYNPTIDLLRAYQNRQIVYFGLPTLRYQETARGLARLVLQDLKTVAGLIQSDIPPEQRHHMSVIVDEFASFAFAEFAEFLNKARASRIGVVLSHQSLSGDLKATGEGFFKQVVGNTNTKVFLRQDDADDAQYISRLGGTFRDIKETVRTETGFLGLSHVEQGRTYREEDEPLLPEQLIKTLRKGHGAVVQKLPDYLVDVVALDFPSPAQVQEIRWQPVKYVLPTPSDGPCLASRAAERHRDNPPRRSRG